MEAGISITPNMTIQEYSVLKLTASAWSTWEYGSEELGWNEAEISIAPNMNIQEYTVLELAAPAWSTWEYVLWK